MSPVKPDNSPETQTPESEDRHNGQNNLPDGYSIPETSDDPADDNETSSSDPADIIADAGTDALSRVEENDSLSDIKIDAGSIRDDILADDTFVRLLKKWAAEDALSGGAGRKTPEGEAVSGAVDDMISADEPLANKPAPELETA